MLRFAPLRMSVPDPAVSNDAGAPAPPQGEMAREAGLALRNTVKLVFSLTCTWSVTLLVRFQLPRALGPLAFGQLNFAESFTAALFAFLDLGVDVYIQKEVSVRPRHASDFFGALVIARAVVSLILGGAIFAVLHSTARPPEVQSAAMIFALGYFVTCVNNTLAALLQASTRVGWLAMANVLAKVAWGAGLLACIGGHQPMFVFAIPMLGSELLRFALLLPGARAAVALELRVDFRALWKAFVASLPYFIGGAAIGITGRMNVTVLEFLSTDKREVGWLGAASSLGMLAMLMSPVLSWIVMPMLARARQRSVDEVFTILRFALEGLLVVSIPVTLFIGIGADLWVRIAFGKSYAQAALALVAIAPQFVFTYTAMILSIGLVILDQQWKATRNSLVALVITPLFIVLIAPLSSRLGEGGAAAGAALAVVFSEIVISASCLYYIGRRAVGRRTRVAAAKSIGIALGVIALDRALRPIGFIRIAIDMSVYVAAALGLGAVRAKEALLVLRMVRQRRA